MTVIVTLDMYSGIPNPSWEISEVDAAKLSTLLAKKRTLSDSASPGSLARLGYRGLILTSTPGTGIPLKLRAFDGILESSGLETPSFVDHDSELESFLLACAGSALKADELQFIEAEIQKNARGGIASNFQGFELLSIPPYDPDKWNNDLTVLRNNNCYNYGNDTITNTVAQPGRGSGQTGPYPPSCAETGSAAVRDGLTMIPDPNITPAQGHIAALVVSTTIGFLDYHWYRRDNNGAWSHKPGQSAVRNLDNSGRPISDPRTCDRGPYNNFCGFFNSVPSKITIR